MRNNKIDSKRWLLFFYTRTALIDGFCVSNWMVFKIYVWTDPGHKHIFYFLCINFVVVVVANDRFESFKRFRFFVLDCVCFDLNRKFVLYRHIFSVCYWVRAGVFFSLLFSNHFFSFRAVTFRWALHFTINFLLWNSSAEMRRKKMDISAFIGV